MSQQVNHPAAGTVWSRVEDGFHVGSRNGDFLGYIDRQPDGSFAAFDMRSRPVGVGMTLVDAMKLLSDQPSRSTSQRR